MKKLVNWLKWKFKIVPGWRKCRRASCWDGPNAQRRMMNILSPGMSDGKFKEYVSWMLGQDCDTAHVFLVNQGDGENAGYNCATNPDAAKLAKKRIDHLRKLGFAVVPWILADDSSGYVRDFFQNAEERCKALAKAGLFEQASYVVLGLEMDEYGSRQDWNRVLAALKAVYKGKTGVHHCSGNGFKYRDLGDIVLGQLDPNKATKSAIQEQIRAIKAMGKGAVGFEYARHPDREKANWAFDAGADGVGNY